MTPLEGETAVAALALCAIAPWLLFVTRRWRVSTAAVPKDKSAPGGEAASAGAPLPVAESLPEQLRRSA